MNTIRATIDAAGRLVIPKPLRERVGIGPGEVEISLDGSGLHLEPVARDDLATEDERLVIPPSGARLDDVTVRALMDAGRR